MPVPIPGSKDGSDKQKVKFFTIFGRPKTGFFQRFRGVPGGPDPLDMDTLAALKAYSYLGSPWNHLQHHVRHSGRWRRRRAHPLASPGRG